MNSIPVPNINSKTSGILVREIQFSSVHSSSRVRLFATPWIAAHQASLSITNSQSLRKLMSIESVISSNHLILCRPFLLLLPIPPSIRVFSNESALRMRWPKYWSFSFCISPSNEHLGLISFRMDWLDLLTVQGDSQESSPTPQFKSINSSALSFLHSPTLTSIHDHWKNRIPTSYSPIPDCSVKLLFPDYKYNVWPSLDSDNEDQHTADFASILQHLQHLITCHAVTAHT